MIFHHFTYPKHLDAILRDGLKPGDGRASASETNLMTGGEPVVWLSPRPSLVLSRRKRELLLARGILYGPNQSNLPHATVCLRVIIPSSDKKLKQYFPWLRKHTWEGCPDPSDELISTMDDWIYFGTIAPSRLSVFMHVKPGVPSWDVPSVIDPKRINRILDGQEGPDDYLAFCAAEKETA